MTLWNFFPLSFISDISSKFCYFCVIPSTICTKTISDSKFKKISVWYFLICFAIFSRLTYYYYVE